MPARETSKGGYQFTKALLDITTDNEDKLKILTGLKGVLAQYLIACCLRSLHGLMIMIRAVKDEEMGFQVDTTLLGLLVHRVPKAGGQGFL